MAKLFRAHLCMDLFFELDPKAKDAHLSIEHRMAHKVHEFLRDIQICVDQYGSLDQIPKEFWGEKMHDNEARTVKDVLTDGAASA